MLDVRKPIGYLFTIYGAILVVWGLTNPALTRIEGSAGQSIQFNLDLLWGAVMGLFGLFMLALEFWEHRRK